MSHHDEKKEADHKAKHVEGCQCDNCKCGVPMEYAKQMVEAFTNRETQRHFIRAGVELALGMESIMRNMPMPEQVKRAADISADYFQFIIEEAFCANNPHCKCRDEGGLSKVDLG